MPENKIQYQGPSIAFFDADTGGSSRSGENPGSDGQIILNNTYFGWAYPEVTDGQVVVNSGGFSGTGWWGVEGWNNAYKTPTIAGGFKSDKEVAEYVKGGTANLNNAFAAWQSYINELAAYEQTYPVTLFSMKIAEKGGQNCMTTISGG